MPFVTSLLCGVLYPVRFYRSLLLSRSLYAPCFMGQVACLNQINDDDNDIGLPLDCETLEQTLRVWNPTSHSVLLE